MSILLFLSGSHLLRAEEGMWIPMLVEKYNIDDLKEAGFRLEAEDIYSINKECLKDAIVIFGGGCTGELISKDGLVLTNHHCGESEIQYLSSVDADYLTHGFWAMSPKEELPNPGLSVTFLRYMKDVSDQVLAGLAQGMDQRERRRRMELNKGEIIRDATGGNRYEAEIVPFYSGNSYYLFVYEKFRDVRLVGAPPQAIGNFGADLDNWVWPRHTGDFSLFRIYADTENSPAVYSPSNVPYKARKHLEIDAGGISEGDFTLILGYPGRTTQYLHSSAIRSLMEIRLPLKIELRTRRLEIMAHYMKQSDEQRIQYAHKYRSVSNAWKKWQGEILGLERNSAIEEKRKQEDDFRQWLAGEGERQMKYEFILDGLEAAYREMDSYVVAVDMLREAIRPVELFQQAERIRSMVRMGLPPEQLETTCLRFFKDYSQPLDRDIFAAMMKSWESALSADYHPEFFKEVHAAFKDDFLLFAEEVYSTSIFSDRERCNSWLESYEKTREKAVQMMLDDPAVRLYSQIYDIYRMKVAPGYFRLERKVEHLYTGYMAGLLEMWGEKTLYPDANGTMRVAYGEVKGYSPRDGVEYAYATTLSGLMEKGETGDLDYRVPDKLAELYLNKDFGKYGVNGRMPVCFLATNHTTGGNSGSPVLDGEGRLIGLNFDRQWEGTMSDVLYDPDLCRNIAVDIRYVLFIIDKFAGAGYLLDEMDIVW